MPLEPTSYAVPQNPNAALMDYRIQGPMAGLMVGEQEAALDRAKQQQEIQNNNANALNDITVKNTIADQPLVDATRTNKLAEQQFITSNQKQIDEAKIMEMLSKKSAAERQMASDRAEQYVAVGQSMPDATDSSPGAEAKYQALRASQSPEVQAKLPPNWSSQTHAYISGLMGQSKVVMTANAKIAEEAPKLASEERRGAHHDAAIIEAARINSQTKGGDDVTTIRETRAATEAGMPQSPEDVVRTLNAVKNSVVDKSKLEKIETDAGRKNSEYNLMSPKVLSEEAKKLGAPPNVSAADLTVIWKKQEIAKTVAEAYSDQFPKARIRLGDRDVKVSTPEGKNIVSKLANNDTVTSPTPTANTTKTTTTTQGSATSAKYGDVGSFKGQPAWYDGKGWKLGTPPVATQQPASVPPPQQTQASPTPSVGDTSGDQAAMMEALQRAKGYNPQRASGASDAVSELWRKVLEFDDKYKQR